MRKATDPVVPSDIIKTGEELMFTMDVPNVPVQNTPIVLAQAAATGAGSATQQPDYILKDCKETQSAGFTNTAWRVVDPAYMLKNYLQGYYGHYIELANIKNVTLLEGTKHGKIYAEVDSDGLTSYHYDALPNYVGKDRAVFMVEFEGKHYKIVVDLRVFKQVDEKNPVCPYPEFIEVKKAASNSSGYDTNTISVTFSDLSGSALGQTTGSSPSPTSGRGE